MQLYILLGIFLILKHSDGQAAIHISNPSIVSSENSDLSLSETDLKTTLNKEDMQTITDIVKDISRAKGPIVKSKTGDPEYRRSFVQKVYQEAQVQVTKKLINAIQRNHSHAINYLQELEFAVHHYDAGVDFVKQGGVELLLPLTKHDDSKVASASFSVLAAAFQGNPEAQKHASTLPVLQNILATLSQKNLNFTSTVLYCLSCYLRNAPHLQMDFLQNKGLHVLSDVFNRNSATLRVKLKVIDLLKDLVTEAFQEENEESRNIKYWLKRKLSEEIKRTDLCLKIQPLLMSDDYMTIEKVINCMDALTHVCREDFQSATVRWRLKELMKDYDPYSSRAWYSKLDPELLDIIHEESRTLYSKFEHLEL